MAYEGEYETVEDYDEEDEDEEEEEVDEIVAAPTKRRSKKWKVSRREGGVSNEEASVNESNRLLVLLWFRIPTSPSGPCRPSFFILSANVITPS